ncbi:class I SAM-dependent DNA methyltransferase [Chromatium okenii]|uniref:site-specific DNA-methyltransferase (adenine-specific) n=1 Tax=Chromatium okenii TaxID=61644 RepID=A0A2S7XR28_9GAMM|nr:DNA methyltransferase [Chromatium okenii]PQJ96165.1 class I SAM-dependent DNA methyltransferase [Chromatium okenii]
MTPDQFIAKWQATTLKERSAAQEHFIDLCRLLNEPTPAEIDPNGEFYCFERGAKKTTGSDGWADVWKRNCFGWEYKGKRKNLNEAFVQLHRYAPALGNPPLLIVSDMEHIIIHTAFNGTVPDKHQLALNDLRDPAQLRLLKWAFTEPERLRPTLTTAELTEKAARQFGELAQTLCERGHDTTQVAHFCQQILFCFFAEDIGLLPNQLFSKLLEIGQQRLEHLPATLTNLFNTMATGGFFGNDPVDWFNGGLFDAATPLPLNRADVVTLRELAQLNWSAIEPSILGTLFERGLDPNQREQLGAHYTDPASIMRLVNPVVLEPLRAEWRTQQTAIAALLEKVAGLKSKADKAIATANTTALTTEAANKVGKVRTDASNAEAKAKKQIEKRCRDFLMRLQNFRIIDPACGSGNFLLLALRGLKDLEHEVILDAERLGLPASFPKVGPENVLGIELNAYAAELARVTVWIGEIQWMLNHGFSLAKNPILKKINIIDQRDAVVNADGAEPHWPAADVIVGNPPFLGGSKKRSVLGDDYFSTLETIYAGRISGGADFVTYWFEKARMQIEIGKAKAAGLVSTNSIRGGANRKVLERICATTTIFNAWSDEPWINSGAAVRVSLICFGNTKLKPVLNGEAVAEIYADLTGINNETKADLTTAKSLKENSGACIRGLAKVGQFDVPGDLARQWLNLPNAHGKSNLDVLKPWANGMDIARRSSDNWLIDYGNSLSENQAAFYEAPFEYVLEHVKAQREAQRDEKRKTYWWRLGRSGIEIRTALNPLARYIATPMVAKHRLFVWLDKRVFPDQQLIVIARADDTTFGILHSHFHEIWALRMGTSLGATPRYTPTTTFETFPFPIGLTPADTGGAIETLDSGAVIPTVAAEYQDNAKAIAEAVFQLNQLREEWLNPPEWIERQPEVVAGYLDRILPKPEYAAKLKKRTLTNLYNEHPASLANAHRQLDLAVAAAYGWENDAAEFNEAEILQRLLALNLARNSRK